jgi:hypothetical protein
LTILSRTLLSLLPFLMLLLLLLLKFSAPAHCDLVGNALNGVFTPRAAADVAHAVVIVVVQR